MIFLLFELLSSKKVVNLIRKQLKILETFLKWIYARLFLVL